MMHAKTTHNTHSKAHPTTRNTPAARGKASGHTAFHLQHFPYHFSSASLGSRPDIELSLSISYRSLSPQYRWTRESRVTRTYIYPRRQIIYTLLSDHIYHPVRARGALRFLDNSRPVFCIPEHQSIACQTLPNLSLALPGCILSCIILFISMDMKEGVANDPF